MMKRMASIGRTALCIAILLTNGLAAAGTNDEIERAREYFTNLELVNQDGETVRFFDDVLKDKVVLVNFIFTNCQGACPLMTFKMTQVRDRLENYIGQPLHFVSLSIDPARDTPAALREFAETNDAYHDGWTFLTGQPDVIKEITSRLGQYTADVEAHSTLMLAGNVNEAHWMKIPPQDQAAAIAEKLKSLLEGDGS